MGPAPGKTNTPIYQLKITLKGGKPPIWRRVEAPGTITLADLHYVIQRAMGWHDGHLHQFEAGRTTYGDRTMLEDMDVHSSRTTRLNQIAPAVKAKFSYLYDFGDGWDHDILVEKITPPDPTAHYPRCTAGKRACPPEDCGGIWGYAELLETLANPEHPEHAEMLEWVGEPIDPEAFDLDAVNTRLANRG